MSDIRRLVEIVARLRAPGGCPWDRAQTHESLKSALIEECYEAVEAISRADDANLREELGDLLLHVVMHASMAGERGAFTLEEVVDGVCEKLIRRHPHVFGSAQAQDASEVLRQWEQIKLAEKGPEASLMDGLPKSLPALLRAQKAQKKAARVGLDWSEALPILEKIEEECDELREALERGRAEQAQEEIGDLLFSVANLARHLGVDAEIALADATEKFVRRFRAVESAAAKEGLHPSQCSPQHLDQLWRAVKIAEAAQG